MSKLPAAVVLLLELVIRDRVTREGLLGDLEELLSQPTLRGPLRQRVWLWGETVGALFRYSIGQKGRTAPIRRRRMRMDSWVQDVGFAFRTLRRRWVYGIVAVVTLGLGIGSATAMFSVVDGVLIRSVPFRDPERLVNVWQTTESARGDPGLVGRTWNRLPFSLEDYRLWRTETKAFEDVAVQNAVETILTGQGPAERVTLGIGSASLLGVLGLEPQLGRWFLPGEEGDGDIPAAPVTVLSHESWKNRLGSDPEILGKTLLLNGVGHTVIGVLPPGFRLRHLGMHWLGEDPRGIRDLWVPIGAAALGNGNNLEALALLAPGVTREAAMAETLRILGSTGYDEEIRVVSRARDETQGLASPLVLLLVSTFILLLIGCANVATLALGELHGRLPELSTRAALGAGRGRIFRQLLTESVTLAVAGTVLGAVLAIGGTRALVALAPPLPRVETVGVDLRVLAFATLSGLFAGVLFGTLPALVSSRTPGAGRSGTTRTSSARRGGMERWLVSFEIALTVVLLVAGGLLGRSFQRLLAVDPGFDPEGLATVNVTLPGHSYASRLPGAYDELLGVVRSLPGVTEVNAITRLPFPGLTNTTSLALPARDGRERSYISAQQLYAFPGYHEIMGIPILEGSGLPEDPGGEDAPLSLVISENLARRYWPDGSAVGSPVEFWGREARVVGVVGMVKRNDLGVEADPAFYVSLYQIPIPGLTISLVARTQGDPVAMAAQMRDAVKAFDPDVPVRQVTTLPALIRDSAARERYRTTLMAVFGTLATLLAAVGIGGVTARGVAQRTKELGVRLCLGAQDRSLVGMVLRDGLITGLLGTMAGLIVAGFAGRALTGLLFGVDPFDPWTYASVVGFLLLVVGGASYLPARRIADLDPAEVLREG